MLKKTIIMAFKEEKLLCLREQMELYNNVQTAKTEIIPSISPNYEF